MRKTCVCSFTSGLECFSKVRSRGCGCVLDKKLCFSYQACFLVRKYGDFRQKMFRFNVFPLDLVCFVSFIYVFHEKSYFSLLKMPY